jgi:hypothetical protein
MSHPTSPKFRYPPTRRDAVVDDYHGTPVADPYRWLEDPQAPETHAWLETQRQLPRPCSQPCRAGTYQRVHYTVELPTFRATPTPERVLFLEKCRVATPGCAL